MAGRRRLGGVAWCFKRRPGAFEWCLGGVRRRSAVLVGGFWVAFVWWALLNGLWAAFGRRSAVFWAVPGWRAACGWCLVLLDGLLVCIGRRVAGLVRSGVASGAVSVLLMGGSPVFG
jgi:hypothetical protein